MSRLETGQDSSMEEILASIRRIISEDALPSAPSEPPVPGRPMLRLANDLAFRSNTNQFVPQPPDDDDEILDLGSAYSPLVRTAIEVPPPSALAPQPVARAAVQPANGASAPAIARPFATHEPPAPAPVEVNPQATVGAAVPALVSEIASSLPPGVAPAEEAHLAPETPAADSVHGFASNRGLEDIVTELLRPMLRDWLDANMPSIIEKMVSNSGGGP